MKINAYFLLSSVFFLVSVIYILDQLLDHSFNKDVEGFMYFGGQLLEGDLIWTKEFEDKLPITQYLFLLPSFFQSVKIWMLISLSFLIMSSISLYLFLKQKLINNFNIITDLSISISLLCTTLYIYMSLSIKGGLGHINIVATSLFVMAIYLFSKTPNLVHLSRKTQSLNILIGCLLVATSISMRPYYIGPSFILSLWFVNSLHYDNLFTHQLTSKHFFKEMFFKHFPAALCIFTLIGLLAIFINFIPFVLKGQISSVFLGLKILSQNTNPLTGLVVIGRQISYISNTFTSINSLIFFIFIPLVVYTMFSIVDYKEKNNLSHRSHIAILETIMFCVLMPLSLEIMFIMKHFWEHYAQMFAPFLTIGFAFSLAQISKLTNQSKRWKTVFSENRTKLIFTLFAILLLIEESFIHSNNILNPNKSTEHLFTQELVKTKTFENIKNSSFFAPYSMHIHWNAKHPRHGFPHQSNTRHIERGHWLNAAIPEGFIFPKNSYEYCFQILNSKVEYILVPKSSVIANCMMNEGKNIFIKYKLNPENDQILLNKYNQAIYRRVR